jgi:hypothetical protein
MLSNYDERPHAEAAYGTPGGPGTSSRTSSTAGVSAPQALSMPSETKSRKTF